MNGGKIIKKTSWQDSLQAELFRINPTTVADLLLPLFVSIWEQEQLSHDWTHETCVEIDKKSNLSGCNGEELHCCRYQARCSVIM